MEVKSLFSLILHCVTDGPTDRRTDRRTDGRTERVTYRVSCTRLLVLQSYPHYLLSIPGKFHQRVESFMRAKVATTKKQFLQQVSSPDFIDLVAISPDAAICIFDGLQVYCRNLPHIR